MQVPKTHREVRPAYGVPEIGTISNGAGNVCERRKRELLVGFGGMPPPQKKIFRSESLKTPFPALSGRYSCVKKVP